MGLRKKKRAGRGPTSRGKKTVVFKRKLGKKAGISPGTVETPEGVEIRPAKIEVIDYSPDEFKRFQPLKLKEEMSSREPNLKRWVSMDGLGDIEAVQTLGALLDIHPLVQEDILHTTQRPKLEEYDNLFFVVARIFKVQEDFDSEQISFLLGDDFVFSIQERNGEIFDAVRHRIERGQGRIRKLGADYLLYALMDVIVDHYFPVLERIGERVEELSQTVISDPEFDIIQEVFSLKTRLALMRRSLWPLREVVASLQRTESELIREETLVFWRDLYDHVLQAMDATETLTDVTSGMLDLYLSSVSNRMNEVMKILTIVATIFIPLTFIAGIYGMNFERMPELSWTWGYFGVLSVMAVTAGGMLVYFRRKRWL